MNTIEHPIEADETSVLPPVTRKMKIVMAACVALGIMDGVHDYVMFADDERSPIVDVQK